LPEVLASAEILLAILEPDAGRFSVPSKVLGYLCAGRPVVASVPADNLAARVVERSGGGIVVAPGSASGLVDAVAALLEHPELREKLGRAGRDYAKREFDLPAISERFERVLASAIG
jgi:glycosyltransferase involved in cell wall biosynthesis